MEETLCFQQLENYLKIHLFAIKNVFGVIALKVNVSAMQDIQVQLAKLTQLLEVKIKLGSIFKV